jgi:uroporphyrinogen decarboxylase
MQIDAGAEAVQIFDSWGGILSPAHYKEFSAPYTARIISALRADGKAPVILFVGNGSHLVPLMAEQKPDALSLDWRISADQVRREIPDSIAIQGNLDPLVLYGTAERTGNETRKVLAAFGNRKGYVFNLGHGIHPATPIENVQAMIESIRSFKRS